MSRRLPGGSALRSLSSNFFSLRLSTPSTTKVITSTLGATTLLLLAAFLFPHLPEQVSAEEQGTTAALNIETAVAISIPSEITIEADPEPDGKFQSTSATLGITTNNFTGYDLYLSAADGDNVLRNENPTIEDTINPTADGTKQAEFTNNTWGYNLSGGSSTQTPDTYNAVPKYGTIALDSTTAPSTNGNGADGGETMSPIQVAVGGQVKLPANTYTKTDEVFSGWNTQADGGGTSYDDQATYTAATDPSESDLNVTLYAQWGPNVQYIQNFTNAQCQSLASSSNYTVVDQRDNNEYTVRYINGACWMTQNLRLSGGRTLTSADSNVASSWSFPSTPLAGSNSSYTAPQVTISSNISYGGYYNYCAASAGSVCEQTEMDATQSICPAGWTLPTGGSGSQQSGITGYGSAFSPVYSGYYYYGSLGGAGSSGYWWSATAVSSYYQYILRYGSGSLGTSNNYKYNGYSVRCVRSS